MKWQKVWNQQKKLLEHLGQENCVWFLKAFCEIEKVFEQQKISISIEGFVNFFFNLHFHSLQKKN